MSNTKVMTPQEFYRSKGYISPPTPMLVTEYAEYYHAAQSIQDVDSKERELKEHLKEGYDRAVVDMSKVPDDVSEAIKREYPYEPSTHTGPVQRSINDRATDALKKAARFGYSLRPDIEGLRGEWMKLECTDMEFTNESIFNWFKDKLTLKIDGDGK